MSNYLEGQVTRRYMNVIFLLNTASSMRGARIAQLNALMPAFFGVLADAAQAAEAEVKVRVIAFNRQATWVIGDKENGVEAKDCKVLWQDLEAAGAANTAEAINLAQSVMNKRDTGNIGYYSLAILISDGGSSSNACEMMAATKRLKASLRGTGNPNIDKVQCVSIGVIDADMRELEDFASKGWIPDSDGFFEEENVPLAFLNKELAQLDDLITSVMLDLVDGSVGFLDDEWWNDEPSVDDIVIRIDDIPWDQDISWNVE